MVAIVMSFVTAILLIFNTAIYAKSYGTGLCHSSQFICYKVKRHETWENLFPNYAERDLVKRLNRTNTRLYPGRVIAIPRSDDANLMDYSPLPFYVNPPGVKTIRISLHHQAFGAYSAKGTLVHWGPVSTALGYCSDIHRGCHTPIGHFAIQSKEGAGCYSTKFPVGRGGAPMPYCMFFHGGFAMHGSYELPGYNASHGCVRMFIDDAKWLNQEFTAGIHHVPVIITP